MDTLSMQNFELGLKLDPELDQLGKVIASKIRGSSNTGYVHIHPDTKLIEVVGDLDLTVCQVMPGKFICVSGTLICTLGGMESFEGMPEMVGENFIAIGCKHITSLDHFPKFVGLNIHMHGSGITSLHNIHKHIKYIGGELKLGDEVKSHILGVLAIKGLKAIHFNNNVLDRSVAKIINKHLDDGKDINMCQEELMDDGYFDYAKL